MLKQFDEEFLSIYSELKLQPKHEAPSIWMNISSSSSFKEKLKAITALGGTLCDEYFSWELKENNLEDRGIAKIELRKLIEPFVEDDPSVDTLLIHTRKIISLFGLKYTEIDVMGMFRSFLYNDKITCYGEPSELFQTSNYSKTLLGLLASFPNFCMNSHKRIENISLEAIKPEFHSLLNHSTRLDWFAGFSYGTDGECNEFSDETIEIVKGSELFMLTFVEGMNTSIEDSTKDLLKIVAQMRFILSQTTRASVVKDICNFHQCICCHGILRTNEKVLVLTMKPFLYRKQEGDETLICTEYHLYLTGIYDLGKNEDRVFLCEFLVTSAYMTQEIMKLVGIYLKDNIERSQQSTILVPKRGNIKHSLAVGDIIFSKFEGQKGYAISIDAEIQSNQDKPMYEGTILGTNCKCIVKIYNNSFIDNFQTEIVLNPLGIIDSKYNNIPFAQSDVTLKGIPLPEYINKQSHDKKKLMIQLLVQLYNIHNYTQLLHNDIKPENIIVYEDYPYFIDFEASKLFSKYDQVQEQCIDSTDRILTSSSGTRAYNPPEKENNSKCITPKSDIYSLGLVFYKMLDDFMELNVPDIKKIMEILERKYDEDICNLIKEMIQHDIKDRPLAESCLSRLGVNSENEYENYEPPVIVKPPVIPDKEFTGLVKSKRDLAEKPEPTCKKNRH